MLAQQKRWYAEHLPLADAVIADVGANVGELSELFWREAGARGRVISIEPLRSNVRALAERIAALGAERWHVEACACSDRDGALVLAPQHVGYAWNSAIDHGGAQGPTVSVPCRRLVELAPDATVVKLDIEGHEYAVLDDALDSASPMNDVRAWALELHERRARPLQQVLGQLARHGYRLYAAGRRRTDPHGDWIAVDIDPALDWSAIPAAKSDDDPTGSAKKMLHVIATRHSGGAPPSKKASAAAS
ncbi:MAG TPA: FkbM family methyltransferase [Nannocystaceae bacterium]|nr:FkbM family methyltransferase [Nannocystaceae bacterium]